MDPQQRRSLLASVGPFALLDGSTLEDLTARATFHVHKFGDAVFAAGDAGDAMYVVVSGKARVVGTSASGEETSLAVLRPGDFFGIAALLSDEPRNATVRAADELMLLRLSRADFERAVGRNPTLLDPLRRYVAEMGVQNFLRQFTALESLPPHVLRTLVGELEEVRFPSGETIVRQGEVGDRFFIVRRGVLEAVQNNGSADRVVGQIGEGEFFGELALLTGAPRAATVRARTDCELFAMSRRGFDRALAASPEFRARLEERASLYRAAAASGADAPAESWPAPEHAEAPGEEGRAPRRAGWLRRHPFIPQHDETDCAAACMAMITAYHRVPVGVARLRDMANVDADGATLWSVAQAAESLGFHARGLQLTYEALKEITLPALVHWQGFHYIVLYEIDDGHVLVGDPAIGLKRIPAEEFRRAWTGRALELIPTAKLGRADPITSPFRRFWPILRPHAGLLGEVLAASLVLNLLGLGIPLFTQTILDRVLVTRAGDLLNILLVGMIAIAVFQATLNGIRRLLLVHVSSHANARLVSDFLRHVLALPMRFFDLRRVGDVLSRVQENEKVRAALVGTIPGIVLDTFLALGYIALMAFYNLRLTMIVLAVVPLFVVLMLAFTPAIRRNRKEHFARHADAWSLMIESFTGIGTVKATAVEPSLRWRMDSLFVESVLVGRKGAHLETVYSTLASFLQTAGTILFLWYGARQVLEGAMTVGQMFAFTALAASVIGPILRLVEAWDDLQDVRNALERLNDVFDAKPEEEGGRALLALGKLEGRVKLEKVTFRYSGAQDRPVLAGVTLEIAPGETIAVVGRSGSGKSTLAKLILGLYPPSRGRVLIDGHDVRTLDRRALRRRVGVVPQEVFLFSGTIRDNIALGDPDVPLDQVVRAARMAGAHEFVCQAGMGYDTKVGERGMAISGGQRQRIALARALLRSPDVLILDEATSALDNESERAIQASLREVCRGRTTIVIAHRLSTVRHADRILVLDGGIVVEEGKHQDLVAKGGLYAHLVGEQIQE